MTAPTPAAAPELARAVLALAEELDRLVAKIAEAEPETLVSDIVDQAEYLYDGTLDIVIAENLGNIAGRVRTIIDALRALAQPDAPAAGYDAATPAELAP